MFAVAIDGPAGAGKSSVAKAAAKELGFVYVDTGAIYRTIALHVLRQGVDPHDAPAVEALLPHIQVELAYTPEGQKMLLNGEDVTGLIRTPEVSMATSACSAIPAVRAYLLQLQRDLAEKNNVLMDGRDIGTVVLPQAQLKVFLTASPQERARRRVAQLAEAGQHPAGHPAAGLPGLPPGDGPPAPGGGRCAAGQLGLYLPAVCGAAGGPGAGAAVKPGKTLWEKWIAVGRGRRG